jgi:WD40 repeat protein
MGNSNTKKRKASSISKAHENEDHQSIVVLFEKIQVATFSSKKDFRWYFSANSLEPMELHIPSVISITVDPQCTKVAFLRRAGSTRCVIDVWCILENKIIATAKDLTQATRFAFSNDASKLAICSVVNNRFHTKIMDLRQNEYIMDFIREAFNADLCRPIFSPDDGRLIIAANSRLGLSVYDITNGRRLLFSLDEPRLRRVIVLIAISTASTYCAAFVDAGFTVWNFETGEQRVLVLYHDALSLHTVITKGACFAANDQLLQAYDSLGDSFIALWDTRARELLRVFQCFGGVNSIAFNPENNTLALAFDSNMVHVYNVETAEKLAESRVFRATVWGVYCVAPTGMILM